MVYGLSTFFRTFKIKIRYPNYNGLWTIGYGLPSFGLPDFPDFRTFKIFSPDLQSVISTPLFFITKHLYNPKTCLPLQPAKEIAGCS
jgi:hypothetical protein